MARPHLNPTPPFVVVEVDVEQVIPAEYTRRWVVFDGRGHQLSKRCSFHMAWYNALAWYLWNDGCDDWIS